MTSTDGWDEVEKAFAEREKHEAFREAIAAMRWLADRLQQDQRLRDLQPGVSHASLVFRCRDDASVWVSSIRDRLYKVSLVVGTDLETVKTTTANESSVVDVVREYVEKK